MRAPPAGPLLALVLALILAVATTASAAKGGQGKAGDGAPGKSEQAKGQTKGAETPTEASPAAEPAPAASEDKPDKAKHASKADKTPEAPPEPAPPAAADSPAPASKPSQAPAASTPPEQTASEPASQPAPDSKAESSPGHAKKAEATPPAPAHAEPAPASNAPAQPPASEPSPKAEPAPAPAPDPAPAQPAPDATEPAMTSEDADARPTQAEPAAADAPASTPHTQGAFLEPEAHEGPEDDAQDPTSAGEPLITIPEGPEPSRPAQSTIFPSSVPNLWKTRESPRIHSEGGAAAPSGVAPMHVDIRIALGLVAGAAAIMYTRHMPGRVLDHPIRRKLYDALGDMPMSTITRLSAAADSPRKTAEHHLRVLAQQKFVTVVQQNGIRYYYRSGERPSENDLAVAQATRMESAQRILEAVRADPGVSVTEVAMSLGFSKAHVSYHVQKLTASGALAKQQDGRAVKLFVRADGAPEDAR